MSGQASENAYPAEPVINKGELPDPFTRMDGSRIATPTEWPAYAQSWRDRIIEMEYGGLPPKPDSVEVETLCHSQFRTLPGRPKQCSYRVHCRFQGKSISFTVKLLFPDSSGPFPAIINGDGCWWTVTLETVQKVMNAGCALLIFNRTEFAEDLGYSGVPDSNKRTGGLYDLFPDQAFGAVSAWSWGYHRCVDFLQQLPFIDAGKIAVTGHSRGGKAALLAGATDERIALVNDNASCAGGSAAFRYVGNGGESLDIINYFPSWFGKGLRPFLGAEDKIPFDQHCLLACVAPRPMLLTYALDDRWSNPEGMVQCSWAAREVYRFLGAPDDFAFHLRKGVHQHAPDDWDALLDFIAWKWRGKNPTSPFNKHPYTHLRPVFSWKAPGG